MNREPAAALALDPDDDTTIVARVLAGDRAAFRLLVDRHRGTVYRVVRHLAPWHCPAEELAQDVFVAAFAGLGSFDPARGRFAAWLCAIARHRALNARQRRVPTPLAELPQAAASRDPLQTAVERELLCRLDRALTELPPELGVTFVLKELAGLSSEEVAAADGVDVGTVRTRLFRARERLREALGVER